MSVPKKRQTSSARNRRRSHDSIVKTAIAICSKCKKSMQGHRACPHCGAYKGKATVLSKKVEKKEQRARLKSL